MNGEFKTMLNCFHGYMFAAKAFMILTFAGLGGFSMAEESVPLFNGKDFSGWRFSDYSAMPKPIPAAWKIENGSIIGIGDPKSILASQWDYSDFELEFEWKATREDFDADFYIHGSRLLDADPIRMAKGLEGGPQENDRGEGQYNAGAKGMIGGGGKNRAAVPQLQKPLGEWNNWKITANGKNLSLICNNKTAWTCTDHVPRNGYLGFRVFKGPLEIRNIKIKEAGYQSIMNLADWEVYPGFGGRGALNDHWKQTEKLWVFKGPGPSIVTKKKDYKNYRLRVEFLFADPNPFETNTGIYLRGIHPWQADIWEHKWGSGLWGMLHSYVPAQKNIQDLGKAVRPIIRMDNPQGHWNYLEVLLEDNIVSVNLNGRTTIDRYPIKKVDDKFPDTGGIGIQAHYPWKEVQFHNLRIHDSSGIKN